MCIHTCDVFCVTLGKNVLLFVSQRCNIIMILVKHTPSLAFQFLLFERCIGYEYWHLVRDAISIILSFVLVSVGSLIAHLEMCMRMSVCVCTDTCYICMLCLTFRDQRG